MRSKDQIKEKGKERKGKERKGKEERAGKKRGSLMKVSSSPETSSYAGKARGSR
jgi:hypothetical protein